MKQTQFSSDEMQMVNECVRKVSKSVLSEICKSKLQWHFNSPSSEWQSLIKPITNAGEDIDKRKPLLHAHKNVK